MKMFDNLLFSKQGLEKYPRLTTEEVDYWHMIFRKILKVGEEFEVQIPDNQDIEDVIYRLRDRLQPTGSIQYHGQLGVKDITTDGSVPHGIELITVGKRFDWKTFSNMNKELLNHLSGEDAYGSNHTGMHIHLLAGYDGDRTELEKDVPSIILANYYQLHRLFAPELFWMASAGTTEYARTRYIYFRRPPFNFSAVSTHIRTIKGNMSELYGKYQMFNLNHTAFAGNDKIRRFHVEVRHPDTILSPSYATGLVALEVALLYKAISLSQCGVISIKQAEYDYKKELFDKFVNLGTGDRESDSSDLTQNDVNDLTIRANSLVRWLKPELLNINPVSYEILSKIASMPACEMRIKGMSWSEIERKLYTPRMMDRESLDKLMQIIVLQQLTDYDTEEAWVEEATNRLTIPLDRTRALLGNIRTEKLVKFDNELGGMILQNLV